MTHLATAVYYDTLPLEQLRFALPALCEAIVSRGLTDPEPEPEVPAWFETQLERFVEPEAEPKVVTAYDAAALFMGEIGRDATVYNSSILGVAWAYLHALNLRHLSADDYSYAIGRAGYLALVSDGDESRYITLRNLIEKLHGDTWLEEVQPQDPGDDIWAWAPQAELSES